jgi:hypothetical protein
LLAAASPELDSRSQQLIPGQPPLPRDARLLGASFCSASLTW